MVEFSRLGYIDRSSFATLADWAAVAVAIALPWSTSAVAIAIGLWLLFLLPTLDLAAVKRELATGAGGLPVLLWCLGVIGMLWADVSWHDRFAGLDGFHRLLAIPLLLAQFRRSGNGIWVACGFFISSIALLITSYVIVFAFGHEWRGMYGVPVHDTIFQGSVFLICAFGAFSYAASFWEKRAGLWLMALLGIGLLFLMNFAVASASRIALVVAPLLILLLGWRLFGWRGALAAILVAAVLGTAMWVASPVLRDRIAGTIIEMQEQRPGINRPPSISEHAAFIKESFSIIASAPIIGHGTGSIAEQFQSIAAGKTGVEATLTVNPHNQTFAVAIQLGLVGAAILWAMWIAHFALFSGRSAFAWLGLIVVTENVLSSTVHSHLFDFNNGWLYVFGVGVLGGSILSERDSVAKKIEYGR